MNAKDVDITTKAAYLCGLYAGSNSGSLSESERAFRKELWPHVRTAALVVFGGGAYNPIDILEMENFYDRIVDEADRQHAERLTHN